MTGDSRELILGLLKPRAVTPQTKEFVLLWSMRDTNHWTTEKLIEQNKLRRLTSKIERNSHVDSRAAIFKHLVIIPSTYGNISLSNFLLYNLRLLNHLLTIERQSMLPSCWDGPHNGRLLITTTQSCSYILVPRHTQTHVPRAAKQCRSRIYYSFKTHVKPFLRPS